MKRHTQKNRHVVRYIVIALVILGIFGWYKYSEYQRLINTPADPSDSQNVSFVIEKGENLSTIAENLKEENLIVDEGAFKLYTKLSGHERSVVAGRFILNRTLTVPEIVEIITSMEKSEIVVTIPEGSTVLEIDEELEGLGLIDAGDFIAAVENFEAYDDYFFLDKEVLEGRPHKLEGYLFPDTYYVDAVDFYSEDLIQLMLRNFEHRIGDQLKDLEGRTIDDVVIMASIVEKEVRTDEDIPVVAGILWKRLDNGWLLGADATLLYLKDDRTITYQDLQEDSPYNTRKNGGLPPGPISNPGLKSLLGTLEPEESPYWYYLTTLDTGEVIYAETDAQHNRNKAQYL